DHETANFDWRDNSLNEDGFVFEYWYQTNPGNPLQAIYGPNTTHGGVGAIANGSGIIYGHVRAFKGSTFSDWSDTVAVDPSAPDPDAVVSNGTVSVGINKEGNLGIRHRKPAVPYPGLTGSTQMTVRFEPKNIEAMAGVILDPTYPDFYSEGWGVGDPISGV